MLEFISMKFLLRNISVKYFVILQVIFLFGGIGFILGLHYIINIKYSPTESFINPRTITTRSKNFAFNIDSPQKDIISYNRSILISGKSGPNQKVLFASENKREILQSDIEGNFSKSWELEDGLNVLKIVSFNSQGISKEETRILFYEEKEI
jgi:hypothetical protein